MMLHKGVMREVNALVVKCPNERDGCVWNGELGRVEDHVNGVVRGGVDRVCEYTIVRCVYQCGFQSQRRLIQNHEMDECMSRPLEVQLSSCYRNIDRVSKENGRLKDKLNSVETENVHLKEQLSKFEHDERKNSSNLKKKELEVETLRREMNELRTQSHLEVRALKQENERQKKLVSDLLKKFPNPRHATPKPIDPLNVVMVEDLKEVRIVKTQRVEDTMKAVDRKHFVPNMATNHYVDKPQSIGHNTTISAPHMHAHTLELLSGVLHDGATALDVGSGSGYLTACMAYMCAPSGYAVGIDCVGDLTLQGNNNIMKDNPDLLRHNVFMTTGDGHLGYAPKSPYDVIHVGGATSEVPQALYDQLKVGGRMIVPVVLPGGNQYLEQHDKRKNGAIETKRIMRVQYGPLLKSKS